MLRSGASGPDRPAYAASSAPDSQADRTSRLGFPESLVAPERRCPGDLDDKRIGQQPNDAQTAPNENAEPSGSERGSKQGLLRLGTILELAALDLVFGQPSSSAQPSKGIVDPVCFIPEGMALRASILLSAWL
jgi:hypothetical protein